VPGIFAAGDVRHGSIKRVASSVGAGSMAIAFVQQYLADIAETSSAALSGSGLHGFAHNGAASWNDGTPTAELRQVPR